MFSRSSVTENAFRMCADSVIAARQDELYATEGSRVTLGCYTVERQPIAYCRFLTPRLSGFAVDERSAAPPAYARYAYSGRGLSAGHCGLSVDAVDESDYGNWTCAVRTLDAAGAEEVSTTVVLRKPEGEQACAAEPVGGTLVCTLCRTNEINF